MKIVLSVIAVFAFLAGIYWLANDREQHDARHAPAPAAIPEVHEPLEPGPSISPIEPAETDAQSASPPEDFEVRTETYSYREGRHLLTQEQRVEAVRRYLTTLKPTDANAKLLLDYVSNHVDDGDWSGPIRKAIAGPLSDYFPDEVSADHVYTECGGYLCVVRGMSGPPDTAVYRAINNKLTEQGIDYVGGHAWPTDEHGWVFFLASSDFVIPSND